jgi:hypothetical protein
VWISPTLDQEIGGAREVRRTHQISAKTTVLYGAVAVLLLVAASIGVVQAGFALWVGLTVHATTNKGLLAPDQMLLVLMLIEILHTVRISIRTQLAKLNRQANESGLSFGTVKGDSELSFGTVSVTWDTKMMEPSQVTLLESPTVWSGRGDLNARPPAPKADSGLVSKSSIFSRFCFKQLALSCCSLLRSVEFLESCVYKFIYNSQASKSIYSRRPP